MAKQKPGVYDRVLECAKEEFLSKGFLDASLRTIAQEAGTSTGSIYTRFGDKEGLFRCLVEPVVDEFRAMFREIQESFHQLDDETQRAEMGQYTARHQMDLLDYIYDHFDVFRLLLDGAHGTRFACFLDELVDIETVHIDPDLPPAERLLNYLEQIKNPYCFRCGDTAVRISFAADGDNLQNILKRHFASVKGG